jgi:RNA polymerase sigma-70 factor, ECF subfamily
MGGEGGRPGRVAEEDRELIARCLAGERAAQRLLFEREKRRVHATLYRIAGHNRGMDDMLQDTFITVFHSLHQFRGEAQLSTWIDRCAVHVALKHLKAQRRARREQGTDAAEPSVEASSERRLGLRQALQRLYAVLDQLDEKQRVAYALHVLEARPMREVATLTDASVVATKVRIFRARREVERRARLDPLLAEFVSEGPAHASGEEADA